MKFLYLLFARFPSLELNSVLSLTWSSLLHSQHELEGAGQAGRRPPKLSTLSQSLLLSNNQSA